MDGHPYSYNVTRFEQRNKFDVKASPLAQVAVLVQYIAKPASLMLLYRPSWQRKSSRHELI